jgi:RNA polymerase sigma-70 factor (ECF subfamily)
MATRENPPLPCGTRKTGTRKPSTPSSAPLSRLSESALLTRARRRDVGAFEELVGRTEVRSYRLAMRHVHNESDAQEILQESYLAAWRNLPTFEGRSQFSSWMYRIVANASLMRLRRRRRHPEIAIQEVSLTELDQAMEEATYPSPSRDYRCERPDQQIQSAELLQRIRVAVESLPEKLRDVFLLRHVLEVSTGDAAARLGVSPPAAKTRLHRARTELRQSLGEYIGC